MLDPTVSSPNDFSDGTKSKKTVNFTPKSESVPSYFIVWLFVYLLTQKIYEDTSHCVVKVSVK